MQGSIVRALQRIFGIQGDPPTPQLGAEVVPTVSVMRGPEDWYLYGDRLASRFFNLLGDATHPAIVQLYNPTGSGVLVIVEGFYISASVSGAAANFQILDCNAATLQAAVAGGMHRDFRWNPSTAVASIRGSTTANADGIVLAYIQAGATFIPFPYVLTPGTWLSLAGGNAERLYGTVLWREHRFNVLEAALP